MANEKEKEPNQKKSISLIEFKMWLEGVEEMQENGWTPDARQWLRIRSKIDAIENEPVRPPARLAGHPGHTVNPGGFPPGFAETFAPLNGAPPSSAGIPMPSALNNAAPVPTGSPEHVVTTPSGMPVTIQGGQPVAPVAPVAPLTPVAPGPPSKTPDIDTSHGKAYQSNFA